MPRYQLKKKCLFVEAFKHKKPEDDEYEIAQRAPTTIPKAHVMQVKDDNASPTSATYLGLNDAAGFIMRFLIQGVDTKIIADILAAEYPTAAANFQQEVEDFAKDLETKGYLRKRVYNKRVYSPPVAEAEKDHTGKYPLNFKINWLGTGFIKGPL